MAPVREIKVIDLPLDEIEVGNRIRMVSPSAVNIIAMSIEDLAVLTDPIHVRKIKNGYRLIDGAHRFAAVKQLGWSSVPTKVWQCTADQAELMESDANISTAHMPPLELAISLAARKRSYQKLHPETRQGHAGAKGRWTDDMQANSSSFASWMGSVLGVTTRQVQKIIAAGEGLTADQIRWLRAAPKPVTQADLQTLAKVPDDTQRSKICISLTNGEAKSAADALKRLSDPASKPVKDPVEEAFKDLREAWSRAPKVARDRFLVTDVKDMAFELEDAWTQASVDNRKAFFTANAAELYDFLIAEGMIK